MPLKQKQKSQQSHNSSQLLFMPRLYNDTMDILLDAQSYFTGYADDDQRNLNMVHKLVYSSEMTRITLRLSTVMSWIMARRAFHAGQLSLSEVLEQYSLQFEDVCLIEGRHFEHILPSYVMQLHDDSFKLYSRVLALDHAAHQTHSA